MWLWLIEPEYILTVQNNLKNIINKKNLTIEENQNQSNFMNQDIF